MLAEQGQGLRDNEGRAADEHERGHGFRGGSGPVRLLRQRLSQLEGHLDGLADGVCRVGAARSARRRGLHSVEAFQNLRGRQGPGSRLCTRSLRGSGL